MIENEKDKLIQGYLDGELNEAERHTLKERLKEDPELKQLLEDYTILQQDLKGLSGEKLSANFWSERLKPAMMEDMGIEEQPFLDRLAALFNIRVQSLMPAGIAAAFVVVVVAMTFFLQTNLMTPEDKPYEKAFARIEVLRQEFIAELNILLREMELRKDHMVPEVLAAYEEGLDAVNKSIEVAERYYSMNADDQEAISRLMAAYDQKTYYLKQFLNLNLYEEGGSNE